MIMSKSPATKLQRSSGPASVNAPVGIEVAEQRQFHEWRVEVVVQTDDIRISGSWCCESRCAMAVFATGLAILFAMARCAVRAHSSAASALRAALRVTVIAKEAPHQVMGRVVYGLGLAPSRFTTG